MQMTIYDKTQQGKGSFDEGRIVEQKPIGFSGEGSQVTRTGPLFYWAWIEAEGPATIAPHPHQAFEIITYVIGGRGRHVDSLGNDRILNAGSLQVMQAGSGMTHAEYTLQDGMEGFQIWLEPDLRTTIQERPRYTDFSTADFPVESFGPGIQGRRLVGPGSPVDFLQSDATIMELTFSQKGQFVHSLESGRYLNALAVRHDGHLQNGEVGKSLAHRDYGVVFADRSGEVTLQGDAGTRLLLIDVPRNPGYRLLQKQP